MLQFATKKNKKKRERERESNSLNWDCENSAFAKPHNRSHSNPKTIALSIATASLIAGFSLDTVAAMCNWTYRDEGRIGYWQNRLCTGTETTSSVDDNHFRTFYESNYYRTTTIKFGGNSSSQSLTLNGSYATITLKNNTKNIEFGYLNAGGTTFKITVESSTTTNLTTTGPAQIGGLELNGTIAKLELSKGSSVGLIKDGTIKNLTLDDVTLSQNSFSNIGGDGNIYIGRLNHVISIDSPAGLWNSSTTDDGQRYTLMEAM